MIIHVYFNSSASLFLRKDKPYLVIINPQQLDSE